MRRVYGGTVCASYPGRSAGLPMGLPNLRGFGTDRQKSAEGIVARMQSKERRPEQEGSEGDLDLARRQRRRQDG